MVVWYGSWAEFDAEVRRRWIDSSERLGLDSGLPDGGEVSPLTDELPAQLSDT